MIEQRMRHKKQQQVSQQPLQLHQQQQYQQFSKTEKNPGSLSHQQLNSDQAHNLQIYNQGFETMHNPSTFTLGLEAPKPPRKKVNKTKKLRALEKNMMLHQVYSSVTRYKVSPTMDRNRGQAGPSRQTAGEFSQEAVTTNYTTTNGSVSSPSIKQNRFKRGSIDLKQARSASRSSKGRRT